MAHIVSSERVYEGKIVNVDRLVVEEGGQRLNREVARHAPSVAIVVLQEQTDVVAQGQQLLLIQQYRAAADQPVIELVAGGVDDGEEPLAAAQRELREELGLGSERWTELGTFFTSPGFTDEAMTIFLAHNARPVEPGDDESEATRAERQRISPYMLPLTLAMEELGRGKINDLKTALGILWALQWISQHDAIE